MKQADRNKRLSTAFLKVETVIGGNTMRPLSLASYDVLLRTGNPLVKGETPADGTPEFTSSLMGFIYAHCAPWPEVVRASFDEQKFREEALIFCGTLTPGDFKAAFQRLEEQSLELEAAQVEPQGDMAGKKPHRPATSRVS